MRLIHFWTVVRTPMCDPHGMASHYQIVLRLFTLWPLEPWVSNRHGDRHGFLGDITIDVATVMEEDFGPCTITGTANGTATNSHQHSDRQLAVQHYDLSVYRHGGRLESKHSYRCGYNLPFNVIITTGDDFCCF